MPFVEAVDSGLLGCDEVMIAVFYAAQRKAEWLGNDNRKIMIKVKTTG